MDSTSGGARHGRRGGDADEWSSWRSVADPSAEGDDPWAWVAAEHENEHPANIAGLHVTAVLVAFDAARWLGATLDGLEALERRPDRLIAIDNGSSDATTTLLERARDHGLLDAVYRGERGAGFGDAVRSALRQDRAGRRGVRSVRSVSRSRAPAAGS
jgi:FMN phosphatase YigB (HAD superfamily)